MSQHDSLTDHIVKKLIKTITAGAYKPGEQLPSVEKLAAQMEISRSTMREALRLLQAMDMIEIIHGRGTFVRQQRVTRTTGSLYSLTEILRQRGQTARSHILTREIVPADEDTAYKLQIASGEAVNVLRRLRFADNISLALETSISAHSRFPDLLEMEWTPETSLYALLRERYQVMPTTATQLVQAVSAGPVEAELLGIQPGSPVLRVATVTYDQNQSPIECGTSIYRGDQYEYQVHLQRDAGG